MKNANVARCAVRGAQSWGMPQERGRKTKLEGASQPPPVIPGYLSENYKNYFLWVFLTFSNLKSQTENQREAQGWPVKVSSVLTP